MAGVLIEPDSGVVTSVPSGRVVSNDGNVRVVAEMAGYASRSPEGRELRLTAMLYAGTAKTLGLRRTVNSFYFRVGFGVGSRAMRLTAAFKKVALP